MCSMIMILFVCFDVMLYIYSGEYNVFDVTLSVYPIIHTGQAEKVA